MTIKELIASKLRPIGDAIREKNGSTELITIDDMPQAIRDIQGGGGIVEVTELPSEGKENTVYKLVNKIGTAIPTTGTIENYYLNVSLSINEVVDILSQLTYQSGTDANTNVVFQTDNHNIICYQVDGAYAIKADNTYVFASNLTLAERLQCSSIGWNVAFITEDWTPKTPVAVNETILTEEDLGMPIGAENDKLTDLFSVTPFEEEKIPSEMYYLFENSEWQQISGGILEVNNLPTSGEDNYVYKLSQQPTYEPYINMEGLGVVSLNDIAQQNGATVEIVDIVDSKDQLPTENIKEITSDTVMYAYYVRNDNYYMYGPFSDDGSKIWFSLTEYFEGMPFKGEVTNTSEMTELNSLYTLVSGGEGVDYYMYEKNEPTQVPTTGLVENLYFNTKLSNEEVDNILSQLTFNDDGEYMIMVYQNVDGTYGSVGVLEANKTTQGQISSGYMIFSLPNASSGVSSMEVIYTSSEDIVAFAESVGLTATVGWNKDNLSVSKEAIDGNGLENDKLINVISTTPYPRWTKISGGGATVKATPIAVPNTGYVERVYFNKSLSFDEVNAIVEKANSFVANELVPIYCVVSNDTFDKQLSTFKLTDHDGTTFNSIHYPNLGNVIWSERDYYNVESDGSITEFKKGWNIEEDYIEINDEVVSFIEGDFAVNVGQHNDQLTELFSINNVFETNEIELSGDYDGTPITVSNMTLQGTEIPTTGTIGTVYCNTSMSVEEVVKVLKTLNYETDGSNEFCSVVVTLDRLIRIIKTGNVYGILDGVMLVFVSEIVASTNFVGWNPEYTTISVNQESTLEEGTVLQNDKLKNILSITPFEEGIYNEVEVNVKELIENQKLPLKVNFKVTPTTVTKKGGLVGTQVPNSGTVENVYFNTNLTYDEIANILSKLTYFDIDSTTSYCWLLDVPSTGESIFAQASTLYGPLEYSLHYIDKDGAWNNIFDDTNLWNSSLLNNSNYISINAEVSDNHALDTVTLTSGLYNNLITELFSSVDFIVEVEDSIVLEGTYDGSTISTNGESAIDITSLLQQKQLPLVINVKAIETVVKDTTTEDALLLRSLTEYSNDRVTSVGAYAFMYCNLLRTVNLPLVTSVGDYAFMNCTSMETINIPNLESIGTYAFNVCGSLKTLRTKAKHIGRFAFSSALTTLIINQTDIVCELEDDALVTSGLNKGAIYVPDSMVDSYKADRVWSLYTIKPLSEYVEE